jgi:hypothetical protein
MGRDGKNSRDPIGHPSLGFFFHILAWDLCKDRIYLDGTAKGNILANLLGSIKSYHRQSPRRKGRTSEVPSGCQMTREGFSFPKGP